MYQLTLQDARIYRKMKPDILKFLHKSCRHDTVETLETTSSSLRLCKSCARSWYPHEPPPPRGNPALIRFINPCEHVHIQTLAGTVTKNQCLECDQVFEKSEVAKIWKNIRHGVSNIITGREQQIDNKLSTGKPVAFVWDPEKYGKKLWDVEYK